MTGIPEPLSGFVLVGSMAEAEVVDDTAKQTKHVLVACSGSVAAIKIPKLVGALQKSEAEIEVKVVTTEHALHFFNPADIAGTPLLRDQDEWETWKKMGDAVLHIELRRWADLMVIAPLDANTLAKMAAGICDNLLTCIVRAWDLNRPLLFAPAMNTYMWEHPHTAEHIAKLKQLGYTEIPAIAKTLACGDTGVGAMAEVETIVATIEEILSSQEAAS